MADSGFARCQGFLNYHPVAKWLSIVCSIATAVLYVGLIILLGFFIDLIVERGEIPGFHQLSLTEREHFLETVVFAEQPESRKAVKDEVIALGFNSADVQHWDRGDPVESWTPRERAVLWWAHVPHLVEDRAGPGAAEMVRTKLRASVENRGREVTANQALGDCGILSLVVRERMIIKARLLGLVALANPWMWQYGNTTYLFGLFFAALALALLRLGAMVLSRYLAAACVLEAVTRLRRSVYHHTNRLGTLAFKALGPAEAVSISTRHLEVVHDGLFHWLTYYFREPFKFGLLLAFTFFINFWLAVAFFVVAVLVWLIGGQIAAYFRQQGRRAEAHSANQLVLIQESLMLMRLVKVYLMEAFNQTRVERQLSAYSRAQLQRYRGEAIYRSVFFFLGLLATLTLLLVAGYVVMAGELGVSSALILSVAIISLYWPIRGFLDARRVVRRSRKSASVLFDFLDRHGGVGQAIEAEFLPLMTKAIQFEKVSLREPGTGRTLLTNVSFTIKQGEKVAIVGPDEMEKHALVYLLPRFLDPSHGEVRLDGKDLRWVTLDSLRAQIAMVLQHNLVFNDTVANNIGCGDPSYNLQRVIDAAKLAHAHQFISKLPQGYETVIGEQGEPLKLGEMFRIALARAILRDPAIMVIEETATPLDDDTKAMIDDTLQRVLPGRTVIYLPHRLTTIRNCDQVFLFYEGKLEASGEHRELLNSSDLYRHLQYLEFNEFAGMFHRPAPAREPQVSEAAAEK
jgi:ATP-binding cassette, subfamily B, bacterial